MHLWLTAAMDSPNQSGLICTDWSEISRGWSTAGLAPTEASQLETDILTEPFIHSSGWMALVFLTIDILLVFLNYIYLLFLLYVHITIVNIKVTHPTRHWWIYNLIYTATHCNHSFSLHMWDVDKIGFYSLALVGLFYCRALLSKNKIEKCFLKRRAWITASPAIGVVVNEESQGSCTHRHVGMLIPTVCCLSRSMHHCASVLSSC